MAYAMSKANKLFLNINEMLVRITEVAEDFRSGCTQIISRKVTMRLLYYWHMLTEISDSMMVA